MHAFIAPIFLFLLSTILVSGSAAAACSRTLTMAYPGWSRSNNVTQEHKFRLDNELLEGILATAACDFTHVIMPFKRIQEGVKHGVFDGTVSVSKSPERAEYGWFSVPYRPEIIAIFMRSDEIGHTKLNSLNDILLTKGKINIGLGTWHGTAFENLVKNKPELQKRLIYIDDAPMMHNSLYRGRVNMVIGDLHYSSHVLRTLGLLGQLKAHPFHISTEDVHLIFSKKTVSKEDLETINKAIITFRKTPAYKAILTKYEKLE